MNWQIVRLLEDIANDDFMMYALPKVFLVRMYAHGMEFEDVYNILLETIPMCKHLSIELTENTIHCQYTHKYKGEPRTW